MTTQGSALPNDAISAVVDRVASQIYGVPDPHAGIELLADAAIEIGFIGACCCLWPRSCLTAEEAPAPCLLLYGPLDDAKLRDWLAEYRRSAMHTSDPCFAICRTSTAPFVWSRENLPQVVRGHAATQAQLHSLDALHGRTGIRSGLAIPLQTPGSWFGYCSFASTSHVDWLREHREAFEDPLLTLSYRFYDAMADRLGALIARKNGLSEQELECLRLLAVGKTVEEIGRICGLPYSTVRSRLRSAERKLAARNRSHAIATAAALGVLEGIH